MYRNIVSDTGTLGDRPIAAGNVELDRADFSALLPQGVLLATAAVTVPVGTVTAITAVTIATNSLFVRWKVTASPTPETFVATLTITTNDGQTLSFTVTYEVIPLQVA